MEKSYSASYAAAGVDITAGYKARMFRAFCSEARNATSILSCVFSKTGGCIFPAAESEAF